jgi:hypothetical protein
MKKQTRRKFIASTVALTAGAAAYGLPTMETKDKKQLVHHVFFWLKNRDSKEDLNKLLEGLRTLAKIESIRKLHIGVGTWSTRATARLSLCSLMMLKDRIRTRYTQSTKNSLKIVHICGKR